MKKIVGVCGSLRKNGNSVFALNYIYSKISKEIEMQNYYLSELSIEMCDGCLLCEDHFPCPKDDMMPDLLNAFLNADILLFVTPVYFDSLPGVFKNILDRTNPLCNQITGKQALIITFGQADQVSWNRAINCLENYFEVMGIEVIEKKSFYARLPRDAENDNTIITELDAISRKILHCAKDTNDDVY